MILETESGQKIEYDMDRVWEPGYTEAIQAQIQLHLIRILEKQVKEVEEIICGLKTILANGKNTTNTWLEKDLKAQGMSDELMALSLDWAMVGREFSKLNQQMKSLRTDMSYTGTISENGEN